MLHDHLKGSRGLGAKDGGMGLCWQHLLNGVLIVAVSLTMTIAATVTVHASSENMYSHLCGRWNLPRDIELAVSNLTTFQNQMLDSLSNFEDDDWNELNDILSDDDKFRIFWEKNNLPQWGFSDSTLKFSLKLIMEFRKGTSLSEEDLKDIVLYMCSPTPSLLMPRSERVAHKTKPDILAVTIMCAGGTSGALEIGQTPWKKGIAKVLKNLPKHVLPILMLSSCARDISQWVDSGQEYFLNDPAPYP